jgi:hypothetical protein
LQIYPFFFFFFALSTSAFADRLCTLPTVAPALVINKYKSAQVNFTSLPYAVDFRDHDLGRDGQVPFFFLTPRQWTPSSTKVKTHGETWASGLFYRDLLVPLHTTQQYNTGRRSPGPYYHTAVCHSAPIIHQTAIWARSATVSADTGQSLRHEHQQSRVSFTAPSSLCRPACLPVPGAPPVESLGVLR